jgi:hypothetical protein
MSDHPETPSAAPSPGPDVRTWHVLIHGETATTSYLVPAESELIAAAIAGQEHDEDDRIGGVDVQPWTAQ